MTINDNSETDQPTMLFVLGISQTVNIVIHDVIRAFGH